MHQNEKKGDMRVMVGILANLPTLILQDGVSNSRMSDSDDDSTRSPAFLTINDVPIYFNEDWDIGIGGGLWTTGKIPDMM